MGRTVEEIRRGIRDHLKEMWNEKRLIDWNELVTGIEETRAARNEDWEITIVILAFQLN